MKSILLPAIAISLGIVSFTTVACPEKSQAIITQHSFGAITFEHFQGLEYQPELINKMMAEGSVFELQAGEPVCVIKTEWQFYRAVIELNNGRQLWIKDSAFQLKI